MHQGDLRGSDELDERALEEAEELGYTAPAPGDDCPLDEGYANQALSKNQPLYSDGTSP